MRVRSWQGACEQGVSEAGDVLPAGNGFLAGFAISVPGRQASPAGLGKGEGGKLLLPPPLALPSCLQKQAVPRQRK